MKFDIKAKVNKEYLEKLKESEKQLSEGKCVVVELDELLEITIDKDK